MTRAAVIHAARDLRIEDTPVPALGPHDVEVRIGAGGICGSDLHYYLKGGIGAAIRLREPMILGHEVAGTVAAVGAEATSVAVGDRVAVNPSRPCAACRFCLAGQPNHCLDMRFYGSAMRMPHVQGAFRDVLVCEARQCVPIGPKLSLAEAALAEPFAVALHAVGRAGDLLGKRVLIAGAGPIGTLVAVAARLAGAAEIAVTDIVEAPLRLVGRLAADRTIDAARDESALAGFARDKGSFDVAFECSGAPAALRASIAAVKPRAPVVLVGTGYDIDMPLAQVVGKEIELRGTFRFHDEFAWAVRYLAEGRVDVKPMITASIELADAVSAFDLALDKSQSMKVQLAFV